MQDTGAINCLTEDEDQSTAVDTLQKGLCPYITQPFNDCYCYRITSQKILLALTHCGGNYRQCKIFQRHHKAQEEDAAAPAALQEP